MRAFQIQVGDRWEGPSPYTVEDVRRVLAPWREDEVVAEVRYDDNGTTSYRSWAPTDCVGLTRPSLGAS